MNDNNFKRNLKDVNQFKIESKDEITDIINYFSETGFNAKRLALVCDIYKQMIQDKDCVIFFGLAGALVPAGLQKVIYDFINEGFIDVLVTTGASLTHDLAEALGFHHLQGNSEIADINDISLHNQELNRIYDVYLPNNVYEGIEDFISTLQIPQKDMSVSSFLNFLGQMLPKNSTSILKICSDKNIPIFCPAFTDSGLALQLGFHFQDLNLNHFKDMLKMVDLAWEAKHAGLCVVGGGVPKNFIMQSLQFCPNSAMYAIQITMDRPEPGGLSGATLQEAISWGKVNEKAKQSTLICDATIALPILLWFLKNAKIQEK